MMNNAKYWRIYYKIQGMLSEEFGYAYHGKGHIGGVREQSSLPEELNIEAQKIATYIMNTHPKEAQEVKLNWSIVNTDSEAYNTYVNELSDDLRKFIDKYVDAKNYYLIMNLSEEEIYGGFATNMSGEIKGVFSLVNGLGKEIIKSAMEMATLDKHPNIHSLKLSCIGEYLKDLYQEFGFKVVARMNWDEDQNIEDWNYNKFGRPDIYYMKKEI